MVRCRSRIGSGGKGCGGEKGSVRVLAPLLLVCSASGAAAPMDGRARGFQGTSRGVCASDSTVGVEARRASERARLLQEPSERRPLSGRRLARRRAHATAPLSTSSTASSKPETPRHHASRHYYRPVLLLREHRALSRNAVRKRGPSDHGHRLSNRELSTERCSTRTRPFPFPPHAAR